jgi:hypothetical protein
MNRAPLAIATLASILTLSACGGGSATSSTLTTACTSVAPPQLVYPAPGATGIFSQFDLYVSYPQIPSVAFGPPTLTSASAATITGGPWSQPSPQPTPPGSANPTMGSEWVSAIQNLSAATTYSVNVTNTACNQKYTLGSFTTQ